MNGRGRSEDGAWRAQGDALVQAISGGLLFGIPLLYTLEVWQIGDSTEPPRLLGSIAVAAVPIFLLNRTSGFRTRRDRSVGEALGDTVVALAVALAATAVVMTLLRELTWDARFDDALGKVVFGAVAVALGVSISRHLLTGSREGDPEEESADAAEGSADEGRPVDPTVADVSAAALGALFVAANIAPTEEVTLLAQAMSPPWLIALAAFSLLITYAIVFRADFTRAAQRRRATGLLQHPLTETVLAYAVSLAAAALLLFFFENVDASTPAATVIAEVVVLGLPAAIGGAAGRLAV